MWKRVTFLLFLVLIASGCLSISTDKNGSLNESSDTEPDNSASEQATVDSSSDPFDRGTVERRVHEYVNQERTERGLPRLQHDPQLQRIARVHSEDMASRDFFSHTTPEGENFADRYRQAGYDCEVIKEERERSTVYATGGENIVKTYWERDVEVGSGGTRHYGTNEELARGIVNEWMNSTDHRETLLEPYWQKEGIGIYREGYEIYATQNFC